MQHIESSPTLTIFYQDYQAWLDEGAPQDAPFRRYSGLCANMYEVFLSNDCSLFGVYRELKQFREAGLDDTLPFNENDFGSYLAEMGEETCHLNPARVNWVKQRIADMEGEA